MSQPYSRVAALIQGLLRTGQRSVTEYHKDHSITRVTCRYRHRSNARSISFVVSMGEPNYAERQIIKGRVAVGAPFPVTKAKPFRARKRR